jgi:hypothetical protein
MGKEATLLCLADRGGARLEIAVTGHDFNRHAPPQKHEHNVGALPPRIPEDF